MANLDAELLDALRRAARDAADDGVTFTVNSGWRSRAYQDLLRKAVAQYGSEAEAARWVASATTSPHVSGDAVDIGPDRATDWLSEHGSAYRLCRIYRNEPWHFELRMDAADRHASPTGPEDADRRTHDGDGSTGRVADGSRLPQGRCRPRPVDVKMDAGPLGDAKPAEAGSCASPSAGVGTRYACGLVTGEVRSKSGADPQR
ncbi:hypothetical protein SBADM41S_06163 [Streptomyces badius]